MAKHHFVPGTAGDAIIWDCDLHVIVTVWEFTPQPFGRPTPVKTVADQKKTTDNE